MKAIFTAKGHQYRVKSGDRIVVDRLGVQVGAEISFDKVLLVEHEGGKIAIGSPHVEGATVKAKLLENFRGPKLRIFKMRRRKNSRRSAGFRANLTRLQIVAIEGGK